MISFKVIRPGPFKERAFFNEVRRVNRIHASRIRRDFLKTTETWPNHHPEFHQKTKANMKEVSLEVYTDDEIYSWVNNGTQAHLIAAVDEPRLIYREFYHAATHPGVIDSANISESGDMKYPFEVEHPGIEARKFDEAIFARRAPDYINDINDAFRRGAQLSDHDMGPSPSGGRTPPKGGGRVAPASPGQVFRSAATIATGGIALGSLSGIL